MKKSTKIKCISRLYKLSIKILLCVVLLETFISQPKLNERMIIQLQVLGFTGYTLTPSNSFN